MTCPYCGNKVEFWTDSKRIYRGMDYGPVWICVPCNAYCGCHPDGSPLGRLADSDLRLWKRRAHALFDPLWKAKMERANLPKKIARKKAYKWLAGQMYLSENECHIGMFDVKQCKSVVEICKPHYFSTLRNKRS